jgi:putative hydrolase of the HAD superfamily
LSKVEAVLFDLYGTLIDVNTNESKNEIFDFLSEYLRYYDVKIDSLRLKSVFESEKAQYLVSKHEQYPEVNLVDVFENILKKEGLNNSFLKKSCCKLFRLLSRERLELFPDSVPALQEMEKSGLALAIVSNAQKIFTSNEIRMLGLDRFFKHKVFSSQYGFVKPDHRLFLIACGLLDVSPQNAVYVGDNPYNDVRGAQKIGMPVILINRNLKGVVPGFEPDYFAADLWDAWDWIKKR